MESSTGINKLTSGEATAESLSKILHGYSFVGNAHADWDAFGGPDHPESSERVVKMSLFKSDDQNQPGLLVHVDYEIGTQKSGGVAASPDAEILRSTDFARGSLRVLKPLPGAYKDMFDRELDLERVAKMGGQTNYQPADYLLDLPEGTETLLDFESEDTAEFTKVLTTYGNLTDGQNKPESKSV